MKAREKWGLVILNKWWEKSCDQCFADYSNAGPKLKLTTAAQDIIREASGRQRKSGSVVAKEIAQKPLKSETHISDRLKDWTGEDFLHLAPSDEFYVWTVRKPNYQNDRIWVKGVEDIGDDERYGEMVKNQACIGIFIIFTAKKMYWAIKDKGESWTGQYFRDIILMRHVFPFLTDEENIIGLNNVIFVHDKAPCMRANMTQHRVLGQRYLAW
ncbi:unnamed protein product [Adineta ricciae]|uniref:Uncharacterized protein n=1 Tax=Adineta ricciae TaxID=249248 RepID=A0A814NRX0_ADIRI|nr:unnamed protein product [Adineta ricciae]CAF1518136.1 unnamed protein product [Adineta ricciae]